MDPFFWVSSGSHVQQSVEKNVPLTAEFAVGDVDRSPPLASLLALRCEWQTFAPLSWSQRALEGRGSMSLLSYQLFEHMQASPWCDLLQSCLKVMNSGADSGYTQSEQFSRVEQHHLSGNSCSMATNQIFGDRSDVLDLLKSLADYSFAFLDFGDTGKIFSFRANKQVAACRISWPSIYMRFLN